MNFIEEYYDNMNIYYALILYDHNPPYGLIRELQANDFPVMLLNSLVNLDEIEINNRIFVLDVNMLKELMFVKSNNISQYSVLFCLDNTISIVESILQDLKPICVENVIITKI